eukprot:7516872-Lingulodinium_polyedra.AAC.1
MITIAKAPAAPPPVARARFSIARVAQVVQQIVGSHGIVVECRSGDSRQGSPFVSFFAVGPRQQLCGR